jgi:hypothetical protein
MTMATLIPYRQQGPEAVTMEKTGSTQAAARARSELEAMEGIADLLARLPDAAARSRVLQWVDAIFRQDKQALVTMPAPVTTPALPPLHVVRPAAFQESKAEAPEDWGLSVADLDDWFDNDKTPPPDDRLPEPDERLPEPVSTQPVVSMIHGFVEDFQKLARDWQED